MIGPGSQLNPGESGQILTGTLLENLFLLGYEFSWEDWLEYGSAEEKIFIFDPLLCDCDRLIFKPLIFTANAGPIKIDLYTNVSYVAGTSVLLNSSNRRETSPNVAKSIIRVGSRSNMEFVGTKFSGDLIPSNGAASPNSAGNSNVPLDPFEVYTTIIKAVGLTNTDGNGVLVSHKFSWFEITNGV